MVSDPAVPEAAEVDRGGLSDGERKGRWDLGGD